MPLLFPPPKSQFEARYQLSGSDLAILQRFRVMSRARCRDPGRKSRVGRSGLPECVCRRVLFWTDPQTGYRRGYQSSIDRPMTPEHRLDLVKVELNYDQRARLELISIQAGKPTGQMLVEAAQFLLDNDAGCCQHCRPAESQMFLGDEELEARFMRLLRL
jgi:hypothetical protein